MALLHASRFVPGAASRWLPTLPVANHHHIVEASDLARLTRLLTGRGVGLVLSGGGARGFAHLGVIRALREARVPLDFVGGASIGAIIAAGIAMGWSDEEMLVRYRRSFVDTNPVNDYTFPLVALTRGRKVSRLLEREYGDVSIEDLRLPYFCISANLTTGRALEHRRGSAVAGAARLRRDPGRHAARVRRRGRAGGRRGHQQSARGHHACATHPGTCSGATRVRIAASPPSLPPPRVRRSGDISPAAAAAGVGSIYSRFSCTPAWLTAYRALRRSGRSPTPS